MGQLDLGRERGPLLVPGRVLVVVVQPALPDRHDHRVAAPDQIGDACRHRATASCGWRPTVAHTPSWVVAVATAAADASTSVPMVTIRVTPAAWASAIADGPTPV